jgi:hypothetical protein
MRDAEYQLNVISSIAVMSVGTNYTGTAIRLFTSAAMFLMTTENYSIEATGLAISNIKGSFQFADGSIILGSTQLLKLTSSGGSGENPLTWGWTYVPFSKIDTTEVAHGDLPLDEIITEYLYDKNNYARNGRNMLYGLTAGSPMGAVWWDLAFLQQQVMFNNIAFSAIGSNGNQSITISGTGGTASSLNMTYTPPSGTAVPIITNGVIQIEDSIYLSPEGNLAYTTGTYVYGMCYLITTVQELENRKGAFFLLNPAIKSNSRGTNSSVDIFNGLDDRLIEVENDVGTLQGDVSTAQSEIDTAQSDIETLQSKTNTIFPIGGITWNISPSWVPSTFGVTNLGTITVGVTQISAYRRNS